MDIKDLENFIKKDDDLVGDVVIIKIEDIAIDYEEGKEENWRWFSSYVWDRKKQKGWDRALVGLC